MSIAQSYPSSTSHLIKLEEIFQTALIEADELKSEDQTVQDSGVWVPGVDAKRRS
jgi:hypothetical protein